MSGKRKSFVCAIADIENNRKRNAINAIALADIKFSSEKFEKEELCFIPIKITFFLDKFK